MKTHPLPARLPEEHQNWHSNSKCDGLLVTTIYGGLKRGHWNLNPLFWVYRFIGNAPANSDADNIVTRII